jgi:hypothetical protein
MKSRSFILFALLAALVATPVGYLIAKEQVGTAHSAADDAEGVVSTDGLSVAELKELDMSDDEIRRVLTWREDRAEMKRLEEEDAPSLTVIPDSMPASTVEWCNEETAANSQSEVSDLSERCEVIELAAEGKLAGGTYTDDELAKAKQQAELGK